MPVRVLRLRPEGAPGILAGRERAPAAGRGGLPHHRPGCRRTGPALIAAEHDSPRSAALVSLLVYNGLRIAEALGSEVTSLTYQRGHRVLRIIRKGGRPSTEPLVLVVLRALLDYIGERSSGPLFLNRDGSGRLSYSTSYALIRRLARCAGIPAAVHLSPTVCVTASPRSCSTLGLHCSVSRTRWATPTAKQPGGTTDPATIRIVIPPTRWPLTCIAADWCIPPPKAGATAHCLRHR